jgi:hypothetical protein
MMVLGGVRQFRFIVDRPDADILQTAGLGLLGATVDAY